MAAKCGKDVICEKPLTLFVAEGQALCRAVAEHKRIFQTASENRSIDTYIRLVELVRGGVIGKLKHIEVALPVGNNEMRLGPQYKETFKQQRQPAGAQGARLRHVARPGARAALHPGARPRRVPLEPGLLRRRADRLGRAHDRPGPVGPRHRAHRPGRGRGQGRLPAARRGVQHGGHVQAALQVCRRRDDERRRPTGPRSASRATDGWIECKGWRGSLKASRPRHARRRRSTPTRSTSTGPARSSTGPTAARAASTATSTTA